MPRSSGVYSPTSGIPVVGGTVAQAAVFNNLIDDLGDEITNSIARDGQSPPTADLPMATFKHTGVGDAAARNQYASAGQVQDSSLIVAGTVAGTNTITASLTPNITGYAASMLVEVTPANTNSGAVTLNLNSLGAKSIVKFGSTALVSGDLVAGVPALLIYNGTGFLLLNPGNGVPGLTITSTGLYTIAAPSAAGTTLTVNNNSNSAGVTQKIASPFSSASTTPLLSLVSTASGGFATLSIQGNGGTGVVGTDDLAIFQNGSNYNATIINRHSGASLTLQSTGSPSSNIIVAPNGTTVATFAPTASHVTLGVAGTVDSIRINSQTTTSVGAAGGATALPATPLGYWQANMNGASVRIPYYN